MSRSILAGLLLFSGSLSAAVTVRFAPDQPDVGPFPTDFLTVPDPTQKTGLRVNLPLPDCTARPTDCQEAPGAAADSTNLPAT